MISLKLSHPAHAMVPEVESFTIDSVIKGYHVFKDAWLSIKCCNIVNCKIKEVQKDLSGRYPAAVNLEVGMRPNASIILGIIGC